MVFMNFLELYWILSSIVLKTMGLCSFLGRQFIIFISLERFCNLKNMESFCIKDNEGWLKLEETCSLWRDILWAQVCQLAGPFLPLNFTFLLFICPNKDPEPISTVSHPFSRSPHWPRSVPNNFLLILQALLPGQVSWQHGFISPSRIFSFVASRGKLLKLSVV